MKVCFSLSLLLCLAGCSSIAEPTRTGRYLYAMNLNFKGVPFTQKWQTQWVELIDDGTYSARNGRLVASGRYVIQGNQIRFTSPKGVVFQGHFRGDLLELDAPSFGIRLSSTQNSPEDYFIKVQKKN
jgi:hypothetical protein